MSTIENTGEIRRIQAQHYDSRPREVDAPLLTVLCVAFTAAGLSVLLIADPDRFPVDRGRVVLTMAGVAIIAATVLTSAYLLNRANRKRYDAMMEKLERTRCRCDGMAADVDRLTKEAYDIGRMVERRQSGG